MDFSGGDFVHQPIWDCSQMTSSHNGWVGGGLMDDAHPSRTRILFSRHDVLNLKDGHRPSRRRGQSKVTGGILYYYFSMKIRQKGNRVMGQKIKNMGQYKNVLRPFSNKIMGPFSIPSFTDVYFRLQTN